MPKTVKIIIIDTGAPKGQSGRSFVADESDPADLNGHATNVAEVIRQRAPDAQFAFFKAVPKSGRGSPTDLANALFAAAAEEPDIVNVSLAVPRGEPRLRRAVKTLRATGALIVCGAGNDPAKGVQWPARYPETIYVGALGNDGRPAGFSPSGCDLMLPGDRVPVRVRGHGRAPLSGTSIACAAASGLLAAAMASGAADALETIKNSLKPERKDMGLKSKLKTKLGKLIDKWLRKLLDGQPAETPEPTPAPDDSATSPETSSPDEVDFASLEWCYGGFNGGKATLADCRIKSLKVTRSGLSYAWERGGCEDLDRSCSHSNPCCTCALFCRIGGKWVGGKFDHISTDRRTRGFENIDGRYGGWDHGALSEATAFAFVIEDDGGKRRTNVIVQERGAR